MLMPQQREVLEHDARAWAHEQVESSRSTKMERYREALPNTPPETFERILSLDEGALENWIRSEQRFLKGQIDQATFNSDYHKTFLKYGQDLEQVLSPKQYFDLIGVTAGTDLFMFLTGGLPDYQIGDEIFDPSVKPFNPSTGG